MTELNLENFDKTIKESNKLVLVDFWAPWCGPCRVIAPKLEKLSEELEDKVLIAKVNVDENSEIASNFQIRNIPSLLYFKNGEMVFKSIGLSNEDEIRQKLQSLY
jgi:thioredoxin 1